MIILISEVFGDRREMKIGETFELTHNLNVEKNGKHLKTIQTKVLSAEIVMDTYIDYYCIYVFAEEDGTVTGNNMCGLFGKQEAIPEEILNATSAKELTYEQEQNFIKTCPVSSKVVDEYGGPDKTFTRTT